MASKFVLTAQLQLQAPTNVRQVVSLVNKQLQGIKMNINPVVNTKALSQANNAVQKVGVSAKVTSKNLNTAAGSANSLGSALGAAARRFASITLATGFFLALTRSIGSAVGRAIEFEKEMLKISQVTGKSIKGLSKLSQEVTNLSTSLGVSSAELLNAARTLSQAGFAADKVTGALKILAQTELAATFDNIADTTEGAIAILSQFRAEVRAAGGEVQFLEKAMDAINSVSKNFAVESADLISVVRRTGGVFEAAGGKLNELIALFTSVRATTRETADTIATGFRTIFTRIQRTETIDSLRELGIVLQDTEGKFVGPLEAIRRLSIGLQALDPRDFRFNEIVEQLGGFRQIGKVIPLIKQYTTSTEALAIANNSMGSTAADAAIAQQGLGNQFAKLKEQFDATIRSLADSDTFQTLATSAIKLAESILSIVESLEPLLPLLTALAAFKLGQIALPALGRFAGVGGRHEGGRVHGFAGGGMVPGRGNRDTVPAMLQPGEFVMRKSAVKKIGSNNMADMNNGYAAGGIVTGRRSGYGIDGFTGTPPVGGGRMTGTGASAKLGDADGEVDKFLFSAPPTTAVAYTKGANAGPQAITGPLAMKAAGSLKQKLVANAAGIPGNVKNAIGMEDIIDLQFPYFAAKASKPLQEVGTEKKIQTELEASVTKMSTDIASKLDFDIPPAITVDEKSAAAKALKKIDTKTISGYIFEAVVSTLTNVGTDAGAGFDYINTTDAIPRFNRIFGPDIPANTQAIEAKRTKDSGSIRGKDNSLLAKIAASAMPGSPSNVKGRLGVTLNKIGGKERGGKIQGFADGGKPKGTDTVPAMLTPGEYVMKKSAAQGIGYSNLHRMNQSNGVNGYAAGGIVTGTRGNYGLPAGGGGASMGSIPGIGSVTKGFTQLAKSIGDMVAQLMRAGQTITTGSNSAMENLMQGAKLLGSELSSTGNLFIKMPTIVQEQIMMGAEQFRLAITDASAGISTVDNLLKEAINGAISQFRTAIADASKGISTVDDIMKSAMTAAMTPLQTAMKGLDAEIKKFGKELLTKLKYFDILKTAIVALVTVVEELGVALLEKADDFNILKPAIAALEQSLFGLATRFAEAADDLQPIKGGVFALTNAMAGAAKQMSGKGGLNMLSSPMTSLITGMLKANTALMTIPGFVGQLNGAMVRMVTALNTAATNTARLGGGSTTAVEAELAKVKAQLSKLILAFARLQDGAGKATTQLMNTKAPVMAGGAGGGGGAMMANQMMMAAMMIGMMVTQMGNFDKATEKAINAAVMVGAIFGMLLIDIGNVIAAKVAEMIASYGTAKADMVKTAASYGAAGASLAVTFAMMGIAIAAAVITYKFTLLGEQARILGTEMQDAIRDLSSGTGSGVTEEAVKAKMNATLLKEAQQSRGVIGAVIATVVLIGVLLIAVGLAIVSFGAAVAIFVVMAGVFAAAGFELGASTATVDEKLQALSEALVVGAYRMGQALNDAANIQKRIDLLGLEGAERLKEERKKTGVVSTGTSAAFDMQVFNDATMAASTPEQQAEIRASEGWQKAQEINAEMLQKGTADGYKNAIMLRDSVSSMVKDLTDGGKTMNEALANPEVVASLNAMEVAVFQAARAATYNAAATEVEARARLGLGQRTDLNQGERTALERERVNISNAEGTRASKESTEATKKNMRERFEAEQKAKKVAEEKLASEIALAQQAYKTAQALNSFEVAMVGMESALSMVDMELGALTGSIKQYKSMNDKLISTLSSGIITPEAEEAALATGRQFGIEGETAALLQSMKDNEKIRKVLTEKGFKEFSGSLEDSAANLRFDEFMKDQGIDLSGLDAAIRTEIMNKLKDGLQVGEIEEIMDAINSANEEQIKVLADLAKAQNDYLGALFKFGSEVVKVSEAYAKAIGNVISVQLKGAERLANAQGRELTTREVRGGEEMKRRAPLRAQGLVGGGAAATQIQLERKRARQSQLQQRLRAETGAGGGQDPNVIADVQNEQKKLASETKALTANLKSLSDQSKLAAAIMGDIEKEKGKRDTIRGLISEFTFASNAGRKDMDRNFMALQRVMQTGNLNSIPDEMRSAVGGLLTTLDDIAIGPQGQTGGQIKKMLEMQMANQLKFRATGRTLTAEEMQKIFNRTTKEEQLINDLKAINREENTAAQALANSQASKMDDLLAGIARLITVLEAAHQNVGATAGGVLAVTPSQGGMIYAAEGQPIFKPKGTDTVPAMLTPGEFVVNSKASKRHSKTLQAINSGDTNYLAGGGFVTSHKGYKGGYAAAANQVEADQKSISDSTAKSVWDSLAQTKTVPFGDQPKSIRGAAQINEDTGWNMSAKWDTFNFIKMRPLKAIGGMLKRGALERDTTSAGLESWQELAEYTLPKVSPVRSDFELRKRGVPNPPMNLWGMKQVMLAHQHFSNKVYPNGGAIGRNKNSNAFSYWNEAGTFRGALQWLLTNQDENDVDAEGDSWGNMGMFFANDIRKFYDSGGTTGGGRNGTLLGNNASNLAKVEEGIPDMVTAYSGYDAATSSAEGSHDPAMVTTSGHIPYPNNTAGQAGRNIPNPKLAFQSFENPGVAQFNWLSRMGAGAGYVDASDDHYSFLANMDGMIAIGAERDSMISNARKMLESSTSHYGQYIQDQIFNNEPFIEQLKLFYKNPGDGDHAMISKTLGDASYDTFEKGVGSMYTPNSDWLIDAMNDLGPHVARNTGLGGGMALAGPPLGSPQSDAALGALNWIPWNPMGIVPDGLKTELMDETLHANTVFGIARNMTNGWGTNFLDAVNNMQGQGAVDFTAQSITDLLDLVEGGDGRDTAGVAVSAVIAGEVAQAQADAVAAGEAKDAAADAVIAQIKSPFLSDTGKTDAMEQAFGFWNEVARENPRMGRFRMIHRIPDYARGLAALAGGPLETRRGGEATSVGQLAPTAHNFNALFPYFDALGQQVKIMIREGAITGADADGISIDPTSLSSGVKVEAGGLSVPAEVVSILKQLNSWSNLEPKYWTSGGGTPPPGRDEMMLMHKFFGMGNIMHTNAAMQTDARIALTELATRQFNGFTGFDIMEAAGLDPLSIEHLKGPDTAKNLKGLEEFKEGLVNQRANRERPPERPQPRASGGPIDWSPRGTDTVPAMLTPGEFVMKKSAVDKYGVGFMASLNDGNMGNGGPYFNEGGLQGAVPITGRVQTWSISNLSKHLDEWITVRGEARREAGDVTQTGLSRRGTSPLAGDFKIVGGFGAESARGRRIDEAVEEQRLLEVRQLAENASMSLADIAALNKSLDEQRAKDRQNIGRGVSPWIDAMGEADLDRTIKGGWTGLTDSEWVQKIREWQKVYDIARKERAAVRSQEEAAAADRYLAEVARKQAEIKDFQDYMNKVDARNAKEDEERPAKLEAWKREQQIKSSIPGEQAYSDLFGNADPREGLGNATDAERAMRIKHQQNRAEQAKAMKERQERVKALQAQAAAGDGNAAAEAEEIKRINPTEFSQKDRPIPAAFGGDPFALDIKRPEWMGPTEEEAQAAHKAGQEAQTVGEDHALSANIGNWLADVGGRARQRDDAEQLMGDGLRYTLPFDLAHLLGPASIKTVGIDMLPKMGLLFPPYNQVSRNTDSVNHINAGGYASTSLRIGEPFSDASLEDGITKKVFQIVYGDATDTFYPTFENISERANMMNPNAELIDLLTLSRPMDADTPVISAKFNSTVKKLSQYVSSIPISNNLMGDRFDEAEGIIFEKLTGKPTGVGYDFRGRDNYLWSNMFDNPFTAMVDLPPELMDQALEIESVMSNLSPETRNYWRGMQINSKKRSRMAGRNMLLASMDNANKIPEQPAQPGGRFGFASGGSVFSPRGTDTVPAMLTPGEFVMKKSAVDKYGTGFMSSINEGRGGSGRYMHDGGVAGGSVSQFGPQEDLRIDKVLSNTKTTSKTVKKIAGMITNVDNNTVNQSDLLNSFNTMSEADSALSRQVESGLSAIFNQRIDLPEDLGEGIVDGISGEFLAQLGTLRQQMDGEHTDLQKQNDNIQDWTRSNFGTLAGALPALAGFVPAFMATGGIARGTDTVPAMLTPGEFVMKKSAVDKYGTGFMSAINNGVQRFATGGPVQYLQGGSQKPVASGSGGGFFGGVGDIVSAISDSLSAFTTAFSLFSGLSSLLSNTINGMAEMHITHTIILQGSLSIPGFAQEDIDGIIMNISKGVVNGVDEKIKIAFDQRDLDNENK